MTAAREPNDNFEALVAAAGLKPNADDLRDLREAYQALLVMKARIRAADAWATPPAHVFTPSDNPTAGLREPDAMRRISVPSESETRDGNR